MHICIHLRAAYLNGVKLALRVLAFTIIPLRLTDIENLKHCDDADERLKLLLAGPVTLLGVLGSVDPPRAGVADAISKCRMAGVRVIMITGDQKTTAAAIAKQINLLKCVLYLYSVCCYCVCLFVLAL